MIMNILKSIIKYFIYNWEINKTCLPKSIKQYITKSLQSIYLNPFHKDKKPFQIGPVYINYFSYDDLVFLFIEIFVKLNYYFKTYQKCPFIIDCGSNIGMPIIFFKLLYPNSQIIAFEPDERTYHCLQKNIRNNHLKFITVYQFALSDKDGFENFYYDDNKPGSLMMSTKFERMPKQVKEVKCVRLSNYIDFEVALLKIDVEGSEMEILSDLIEANKLKLVNQMIIEYHHHLNPDVDQLSIIFDMLEKQGFGYTVSCNYKNPRAPKSFQDIMIYAYQK